MLASPPFSVYTLSLGKHVDLLVRLEAAIAAGFSHIELDTNDWYTYSTSYCDSRGLSILNADHQAAAAQDLSSKIDALGLKVLCLQPLRHFEGLLDEEARQARFTEALALFRVMLILKTDLLLIPSSFLPAHEISPDAARIAADLRDLADLAASVAPHLRIGYEALAWGTHVDTWQAAWAVVQRVARANAGLVLDSFNLLARVYADPTRASGVCAGDADAALRASLAELVAAVPPHSIFLLQIADAARAAPSEVASAPLPRLAWSRTRRLFPGERARGAYLPVVPFMHAVVSRLGCSLAWSLEYFNADLECTEDGEAAAKELARRGMKGLRWLWDAVVAEEEGRGEVVGGGSCGVAMPPAYTCAPVRVGCDYMFPEDDARKVVEHEDTMDTGRGATMSLPAYPPPVALEELTVA